VRRHSIRGGLSVLGLCLFPVLAVGQARDCELVQSEVARPFSSPDGSHIVYVVRPVLRCNDGAEIRADSAVMFEATSYSQFFRNVYMRDGTRLLQADTANYQDRIGLLNAQGNVRVDDSSDGTKMQGDRLHYLRANHLRTEDILTMEGGGPTARFTPQPATDSTGSPISAEPPRPVELTARWIRLTGDSLVQARGQAHLKQDSLDAYGDSLSFEQSEGVLGLFGSARLLAPQAEGDPMDLRGDTIVVKMPGGDIERLDSWGRARLQGTAVKILGPVIRLFFDGDIVARVVSTNAPVAPVDTTQTDSATSTNAEDATADLPVVSPAIPIRGFVVDPARPEVTAEEYEITGDSVEVLTPGGEISSVFSSGAARAVSTARDSINEPDTAELLLNDWIEGDSIRAFFEPAPPADRVAEANPPMELRRLVATGNARSLSRFKPDSTQQTAADTTGGRLRVNYVSGAEIRVFLVDGEVDEMEADEADGLFLQPALHARVMGGVADSASAHPDSAGADSLTTPPDTTATPPAVPDTTRPPPTLRQAFRPGQSGGPPRGVSRKPEGERRP
jgi:lipopolysaccharide export system protein LptA